MSFTSIDIVVCLSLPSRADRRADLNPPEGLPPVEWFDAYSPSSSLVPGSWTHKPSYYSTTLGHMRIMENLWLRDDWSTAMILEDDALFLPTFLELDLFVEDMDKTRPDWLALFLGWCTQKEPTAISQNIYLANGLTQSHAYVLRRHGLWRLYDHLWCQRHEIVDWAYCHLMKDDSAFFTPRYQMVTTRAGYSDNCQYMVGQGQ